MSNFTPGPWKWAQVGGSLCLCTPNRGRIVVMDFVRKGMKQAEPRFGIRNKGDKGGLMWPASKIEVAEHPDAKLIAAAPDLLAACEAALSWMTNVNANDPASVGRLLMSAMQKAGYDKATLDDAAVALVRGPYSVPNMMGLDDDDEELPKGQGSGRGHGDSGE